MPNEPKMKLSLFLADHQYQPKPFEIPVRWSIHGVTDHGVTVQEGTLTVESSKADSFNRPLTAQECQTRQFLIGNNRDAVHKETCRLKLQLTLSNGKKIHAEETFTAFIPPEAKTFVAAPWASNSGKEPNGSHSPVLTHSFNLASADLPPAHEPALFAISVLGLAEVYINHQQVTNRETWNWTEFKKRGTYVVLPVPHGILKEGENTVEIVLGQGWYAGHVGWSQGHDYGDRPAVWFHLETNNAEISSNLDWLAGTGQVEQEDLLMGETADLRLPVLSTGAALASVVGHDAPPIIELKRCEPVSVAVHEIRHGKVIHQEGGKTLLDFGVNCAAVIEGGVTGPSGSKLTLHHGEVLDEHHQLYTANLRKAKNIDEVTSGGNRTDWQPFFTFHGFRFALIDSENGAELRDPKQIPLTTGCADTGTFECSNSLVNELFGNINRSRRSNFIEVPTDCPQRDERLGWTGDIAAFARTGTYLCDCRRFLAKWLVDLTDSQQADGNIPPVSPYVTLDMPDGGPAWSDALPIVLWDHWIAFRDQATLDHCFPHLVRYIQVRHRQTTGEQPIGFAGFGDWLAPAATLSSEFIRDAFNVHAAEIGLKLASSVSSGALPVSLEQLQDYAHFQRDHFNKTHLNEEGDLKEKFQTAYALALDFELIDPKWANTLGSLVKEQGLSTGFIGTVRLLPMLSKAGFTEEAYDLLLSEKEPGWLFQIKNGATSIWERWDGYVPGKGFQDVGMNSFNHYAFGAVGQWMIENVAGISALESVPGWQTYSLAPEPSVKLGWAEAKVHCPFGEILSRWDWAYANGMNASPSGWSFQVQVPIGCEAVLKLPGANGHPITVGGSEMKVSKITWNGNEITEIPKSLGSGAHHFTVSL